MNDAERFQAMRVFIAALKEALKSRSERGGAVPFEPRIFAQLVEKMRKDGNKFATRFQVFATLAGKNCPDFQQGMTAAQSAGLISRLNPTYEFFALSMSPRLAQGALASLDKDESEDARKLADCYADQVLGH